MGQNANPWVVEIHKRTSLGVYILLFCCIAKLIHISKGHKSAIQATADMSVVVNCSDNQTYSMKCRQKPLT